MMFLHGRMLRYALAPLLLVLASATLRPASAQRLVDGDPDAGGLPLWEVVNGRSTVYLLGSIHLLRPEVYPLDDAIYEAFAAAEIVGFELDFGELAAAAPLMMARGMYGDGQTLRDALPPDLYAELEHHVARIGMPLEAVERMKPWLAALTLSSVVMQQAGFQAAAGIDMHFYERSRSAEKEIVALETMAEQIAVFDELDARGQIALLRMTLDELETTVERLDEATELWRRGDAAGLAAMFTESMGDHPELLDRLLHQRNRNWLPQLEELLRGDRAAIVIVGMGHLVGEGSVIELLNDQGYEVIRLEAVGAAAPSY